MDFQDSPDEAAYRAQVRAWLAEHAPACVLPAGEKLSDEAFMQRARHWQAAKADAGYVGIASDGYQHFSVNHSVGEYVRAMAHTNGIESFWALLKRGHYGIFHFMSAKHLGRYVNEFAFRHNTSQEGTMTFIDKTIARMIGKRLTYKALING